MAGEQTDLLRTRDAFPPRPATRLPAARPRASHCPVAVSGPIRTPFGSRIAGQSQRRRSADVASCRYWGRPCPREQRDDSEPSGALQFRSTWPGVPILRVSRRARIHSARASPSSGAQLGHPARAPGAKCPLEALPCRIVTPVDRRPIRRTLQGWRTANPPHLRNPSTWDPGRSRNKPRGTPAQSITQIADTREGGTLRQRPKCILFPLLARFRPSIAGAEIQAQEARPRPHFSGGAASISSSRLSAGRPAPGAIRSGAIRSGEPGAPAGYALLISSSPSRVSNASSSWSVG